MTKTKVLFVLLQLDAGGSERVALNLASYLDHERFEAYLVAFKGGALEPAFRKVCKEMYFIHKKKGLDLGAMLRIFQIIGRHKIDSVNAHHYMPCFYSILGARILRNRKLVYTEHSVPEVEGLHLGIHGKLLNMMLYQISAVVGVSYQITDTFKRCYPSHAKKFVTIPNGVDVDKFYQPQFRVSVRQQFGYSPEHFVVGTVANFRKIKNHACIVRAASCLKESFPQVRFIFVGTGFPGDSQNSEGDVRRLIKEYDLGDRVMLAGYRENIPATLAAMDTFCLASSSEGMPVSILEAMAAKVPVIGSRVFGIGEVVNDLDTGMLFNFDDEQELSRLLAEMAVNETLRETLKRNAYDHILKNYSEDKLYNKYLKLFES